MIRYLNPNKYKKVSRYAKLRLIQRDNEGKPYHEVTNSTSDVSIDRCSLLTIRGVYVDRLDLIAQDQYGDASLWWFIAKQNKIADPMRVPNGTVLEIPDKDTLLVDGRVLEPLSYLFLNLGVDG